MRHRMWWAALGLPATVLVLAACGGQDRGPDVATAGGAAGSPTPTASTSLQDRMLQYARCMRAHGVDMPDPAGNGGPGGVQLILPSGASGSDAKLRATMGACRQYLPNGGAPASMSPQQVDQLRQYAQCMRAKGVQMSDPDPNTGGLKIGHGGADKLSVLNDPKFKAAQSACQNLLPAGKG